MTESVIRLAAAAAQPVAAGQGLEAAGQVIRAGLLRLGAGMLEDLLAIDGGYAGPRIDCGQGHHAQLVPVRTRTWIPCSAR